MREIIRKNQSLSAWFFSCILIVRRSIKMKAKRIISGLLAVSGLSYALLAWMAPIFWLGYIPWFGWIAIALGSEKMDRRLFWIFSAAWSIFLILLFGYAAGWDIDHKGSLSWHGRLHLVCAALVSMCFSFTSKTKKSNSNQALDSIGTSSAGPDRVS